MFKSKSPAFLCAILCITFSKLTISQTNSASFTFTLNTSARTSAGVYKTDSTLVKTLWTDSTFAAGTYTRYWDGKDDYGNTIASPDPNYVIKVLSSNVTYTWDGVVGNTSASQTGSSIHKGIYTSMTGMAITGTTAYFCQGYSESLPSVAKFNTSSPQVRLAVFTGNGATLNTDFVATDGTYVYWAGFDNFSSPNSGVFATKVSDDSQVNFGANGVSWTPTYERNLISVIDRLNISNSKPTGLAVQPSGGYLFVSHGGLNELHVLNKTTGALVQNISISNPRGLALEGGSLWMVSGTNTVAKYTVNANGTLSAATLTLSGIATPGAIAANAGNIAVVDAGTNQIVRFYNTSTGLQGTQLGTTGGYATSPDVTNSKYMFDDFRGNKTGFLAYAPDGTFWLGDCGNFRELHFTAAKTYIEYIMSMPATYSICVDPNNISRVFGNYLEFNVDYTQSLSGSTGWTLVRNWAYNTNNTGIYKMLNVVTFSNGRTYGNSASLNYGFAELTSTGFRNTGLNPGIIMNDGSNQQVSGREDAGSTLSVLKYPLTGFDGSGNPVWSTTATVLATTPTNTDQNPNTYPQTPAVTSNNKVVFYTTTIKFLGNFAKPQNGYHLGAIKVGDNQWQWKSQKATFTNYQGEFPKADYFDIGNSVNDYAGSRITIVDSSIFAGYHGEFWKGGQTNYFNHFLDDGMPVGQFGTDGHLNPPTAAENAGNALTPQAVKGSGGKIHLYHGDESAHSGIHRWTISNLSSINKQIINVPFPSAYTPPILNYTDLHAGLPFDAPTPNSNGWTKTGTFTSNTNRKKYVNDGSPDIYSWFNGGSGTTASLNRDLGTNNVSTSWKISGLVTYERSQITYNSAVQNLDVLDATGKIIARMYFTNNGNTGITTLKGNTATIVSSGSLIVDLNKLQPVQIECINGQVTFTYGSYAPVTTTMFDATANWKTPKTFRVYWQGPPVGGTAFVEYAGVMDMRFYKDFGVNLNIAPVANAGSDTSITLPQNTVNLSGSGSDADGTITNHLWAKISGPSSGVISNASNANTNVTNLSEGVYQFQLTVTDNNGAKGMDTIRVTVNPPPNKAPQANAGPDQQIKLPLNSVSLAGSGADIDGSIVNYKWMKISGPGAYTFVNSSSPVTDVFGLTEGIYQFQLEVTDDDGSSALDTVNVTVNPAQNMTPVVDAGTDQLLLLPNTNTDLAGNASDPDGVIQSFHWTAISGPPAVVFTNSASPSTSVKLPAEGFYLLELKVTDNNGGIGRDTVLVSVVSGVLPLELLSFSGVKLDDYIELSWVTANEENVERFQIEKFQDQSWGTIGNLRSTGSGSAEHKYQYPDHEPSPGEHLYRLKIIGKDGKFVYSKVINILFSLGADLLYQNFPNPFIELTTIKFDVASTTHVKIQVYNSVGMQITEIVNEIKRPGSYKINWNPQNLPRGNYYYQCFFNSEKFMSKKMIKLR